MCCGRTYVSNGLIDNAKTEATNVLETLLPYTVSYTHLTLPTISCV